MNMLQKKRVDLKRVLSIVLKSSELFSGSLDARKHKTISMTQQIYQIYTVYIRRGMPNEQTT